MKQDRIKTSDRLLKNSRAAASLAAFCLILSNAFPQLAPKPSAAAAPPDPVGDVTTLSPFVVDTSRDVGYQATDTLQGGRIATALDHTPAAISVLTREFLDDIGATSFMTAAIWTTNASLQNQNSNFAEFQVNFRGVGSGLQTINYFVFQNASDSYNTERLEFTRGPNAIMFGNGNLSGIPTTFTKQAHFVDFTQVQLRGDSYGGYRSTIDENRQFMNGRAAVRMNLVFQKDPRWRANSRNDRQGIAVTTTFKLGDSADFRIEGEFGATQRSWGDSNFLDYVSGWDGRTTYAGSGPAPNTNGTGLVVNGVDANTDYLVYDPSNPNAGVQNMKGQYTTIGSGLALLPNQTRSYIANFPVGPSRTYNLQPPNSNMHNEYYMYSAYLEKQFGRDLFLQVAANADRYRRVLQGGTWTSLSVDVNQALPSGLPNPHYLGVYSDVNATIYPQWNPSFDLRFLGTYKYSNRWMRQQISALVSENYANYHETYFQQEHLNNPADANLQDTANLVYQRRYLGQAVSYADFTYPVTSNGLSVGMYQNEYFSIPTRTYAEQLAAVGDYFGGKLTTIFGLRHDANKRTTYSNSINPDNSLKVTGAFQSDKATRGSAGFVYYPVPWIGPFANYSESYSLPALGNPLFDGSQGPPTYGRGKEAGLQLKLLDGRVQGRISYYDSHESGRLVNAPNFAQINDIYRKQNDTADILTGSGRRDTQTLNAKGFEGEFTANLTSQWRALLNFGIPKAFQNNAYPQLKAYYTAHIASWTAASVDPTLSAATRSAITQDIVRINQGIENAHDGRAVNGSMKYRANFYNNYTFRGDTLKHLSIGGGVNVFGPQVIGNVTGDSFNYIYQKEYMLGSADIIYRNQIGGVRYKVQLNVTNLFNYNGLFYQNVTRPSGLTYDVPNGFYLVDPRKVILSTTFDF